MDIKAFIFDMDGTLLETTKADYNAWMRVFHPYGVFFSYDEYARLLGIKSQELIKLKLHLPENKVKQVLKDKMDFFFQEIEKRGLHLVPFVQQFVDSLKQENLLIALATGARKEKFDWLIKRVEILREFKTVITGEDVTKGKPNPEIFLKAAQKLGLKPEECVVVEDAECGIKAAKDAGMKCLAITTTSKKENLSAADFVVDSFEHLDPRSLLGYFKKIPSFKIIN